VHAVLTAFEKLAVKVEQAEMYAMKEVIGVMFKLPFEKYLALKFVVIEIVEDISFILKEKDQNGQYLVRETEQFI